MDKLPSGIDYIKKAFFLFTQKKNFKYLIGIIVAVYIPFGVFTLLLATKPDISLIVSFPFDLFIYISLVVGSIVLGILAETCLYHAVRNVVDKKTRTVRQTIGEGGKSFLSFLVVNLLYGVVVALGVLLLVIPGLIFYIWFGFALFFVVDKKTAIVESFKKSKALVSGRFIKVMKVIVVFTVFSLLVQLPLSMIPYNLGTVISIFLLPLFILPQYLYYRDLLGTSGGLTGGKE